MRVLEMIEERYAKMSSAEQKVAASIINDPASCVECTVAELAERSSVSDATVVRMCKHLGFDGYYQFRITLALDIEKANDSHYNQANESQLQCIFKTYSQGMLTTLQNLDEESFIRAVDLIETAEWVHIIATGNSASLAQYMGYRLGRRGIRCTFNVSPDYFFNQLNLAKEKDVVFAISRSGTSKVIVEGITLAKKKGMKAILLTDYSKSQAALLSDYVLQASGTTNKFSYFRSHSNLYEAAVIDAILQVISRDRVSTREETEYPEYILADTKYE